MRCASPLRARLGVDHDKKCDCQNRRHNAAEDGSSDRHALAPPEARMGGVQGVVVGVQPEPQGERGEDGKHEACDPEYQGGDGKAVVLGPDTLGR
jgi:hypothetical protein